MKLCDIVFKEYLAIIDYIKEKYSIENDRIVVNSKLFYEFLDTNLYLQRGVKLAIYKDLNLIVCNSEGITSVVYDKETKKTTRKIIINFAMYNTLKRLYETEFTT